MVSIETLEAFIEAFNRHDLDEILSFFADDCIMDLPRGPDPCARAHILIESGYPVPKFLVGLGFFQKVF